MAENGFFIVLYSLLDLIKGSFLLSIPVFAFVFIAIFVGKELAKKYNWGWFKSSLITTFFFVFSLVMVLYILPFVEVIKSSQPQGILPEFQPTLAETLSQIAVQFVRLLFVSILLSLLLMPLEFIGLFLFEKISQKFNFAYSVRLFLAVFLVSLFCSAFIIFITPWAISGILFLIFFGFE